VQLNFFFDLLRLKCYNVKCVKTRCYQEGLVSSRPRFQGEWVVAGEYFLVSTKLNTFCYPTVEIAPCYVPWFWHNTSVWQTDGQTDGIAIASTVLAMWALWRAVKKSKPAIVDFYDIWLGSGEGLFWFRCFINLSLTHLFRLTYLQNMFQISFHFQCQKHDDCFWLTLTIFVYFFCFWPKQFGIIGKKKGNKKHCKNTLSLHTTNWVTSWPFSLFLYLFWKDHWVKMLQFFYRLNAVLSPNQQCQSTVENSTHWS